VVTLGDVAPEAGEGGQALSCPDPLGHQGQAAVVAQGDDALHDQGVVAVLRHCFDERAVDLDLADGQSLELAQTGRIRREVIQKDPGLKGGELLQYLVRPLRIDHDR
jgi:hypothetical protein